MCDSVSIEDIMGDKNIAWFEGYAEPGYQTPEKGVCLANWNNYKTEGDVLEALGVELEWSDEWRSCAECGKIFRTQPDSYCWAPYYLLDKRAYEYICLACFKERHCERVENGWVVTFEPESWRNGGFADDIKYCVLGGDEELNKFLQEFATEEYRAH